MHCTKYLECSRLLASKEVLCCADCVTYNCALVVRQGVEPIVF